MAQDVQRAAIELYDHFTHEGMDRRDFMAKLTRLAGSAAAASALLADVACKAETAAAGRGGRPPPRTRGHANGSRAPAAAIGATAPRRSSTDGAVRFRSSS